ncbi:MAG: tetratricopeptide repeat protein [Chthoniobacterales bacterium]|nr:tetratricopeptide repeat protein [Chthoniobacterales bacterium]
MRRFAFFWLAAVLPLAAQQPFEVRRAEPVSPVVPAVPEVRRAEPVATPAAAVPAEPVAVPAGEIRALPSAVMADPVMAAFEQANGFYAQKMYDMAIPRYTEFIRLRAAGEERQAALFRLGESLRALERPAEAMTAYQKLVAEYRTGDFLGPAAYRLGEMQYTGKDFEAAAASFRIASEHVRDPKLRLASKFFEGRALDSAGRKVEALSAYREVVAQKEDNPYRERAMFDLAEGDAKTGLTESAFRQFRRLAESAEQPQVRTGAAVKAGLMAIDARDFAAARPLLESAVGNRELPAWSVAAQTGLLRLDYEEEKYAAVAERAEKMLPTLPAESKPEVLLLAANAQRQLGRQAGALALYDQLAGDFPDSAAAKEAGFHRLVSLVAQRDERAPEQIDMFLQTSTDSAQKARASLLKAELLFEQKDYAGAEPLYASASEAAGTAKYRADALYKLAWCRLQQSKYDQAVNALTRFLTQFPRHPLAASAMAQRGMAQLQNGQKEEALADFSMIIDRYRDAKEREDAMLQRALLLGNMERPAEMAAAFQRLLTEYPGSKTAAQAQFWIGYVAFEGKKYKEAIPALEQARKLDPENYGERSTLRLLLSHYYLENREAAGLEASALGTDKVPTEVRNWLGMSALEAGDNAAAIEFLTPLATADDASDDLRMSLARAQLGAAKYDLAKETLQKLLPRVHEPNAKARVHLMMAEALIGLKDGAAAKAQADEAQRLQPQGRINAEARLANGQALLAQGLFDDAARAFMAVALLYDEKDITPQALVMAEQAYMKANNPADAERAREELARRYPDYKPPASS